MLLVILVVFAFLRSWRTTLVPAITVPVSLVATFGALYLFGYTVDNLSLMALTIATGFLVDDAIVMIENITRHIEMGLSPMTRGPAGGQGDRANRNFDQPFLERRIHTDPADGWDCRTYISGIRNYTLDGDRVFAGHHAGDHADDVLAAAAVATRSAARLFL